MPLPKKIIFPKAEIICLRQAVQWLAFDIEPVEHIFEVAAGVSRSVEFDREYESDEHEQSEAAKACLFLELRTGRIIARGHKGNFHGQWGSGIGETAYWQSADHENELSQVPAEFWEFGKIRWNLSHVWQGDIDNPFGPTADYMGVRLQFADLRRLVNAPAPKESLEVILPREVPPSYKTPYLALMAKAVAHFGPERLDTVKKEEIEAWLIENGDGLVSKSAADYMAMFIRQPSVGGAKPRWPRPNISAKQVTRKSHKNQHVNNGVTPF